MKNYYYNGNRISAPVNFQSNEPMFSSDTVSLKTERGTQGAQRWELIFQLVSVDDSVASFVGSVFRDSIGSTGTMIMPQLPEVDKRNSAGVYSTSGGAAGSNTLSFSGSGLLPAGSFIKFSNHSKVYLIESDINNSGSSRIHPGLHESVPPNTPVHHGSNCVFTYSRNVNDIKGIVFQDGVLSNSGSVNLIEET